MAEEAGKSALEYVVEILTRHGVEFIIVGGQAAWLFGSPLLTYDIDFCYRRSAENLRRLADALREIQPSLRGAPPDVPFRIDAEARALGCDYMFCTRFGDLDLHGLLEPVGDYDVLAPRAERIELGEDTVLVISLDDLISVKQHLQRPADHSSLMQLLAIRHIRQESAE